MSQANLKGIRVRRRQTVGPRAITHVNVALEGSVRGLDLCQNCSGGNCFGLPGSCPVRRKMDQVSQKAGLCLAVSRCPNWHSAPPLSGFRATGFCARQEPTLDQEADQDRKGEAAAHGWTWISPDLEAAALDGHLCSVCGRPDLDQDAPICPSADQLARIGLAHGLRLLIWACPDWLAR